MTRSLSLVVGALFSGLLILPAHSQRLSPKASSIPFSPAEAKVLQRLTSLQTLPDGPWHFHSGDVAHGESPTLDDSGWQMVAAKSKAGKEAVWYRRMIEVPKTLNGYDLTGAAINFNFRAYANGPLNEIIYYNGRRVALGEDLETIELFGSAKP